MYMSDDIICYKSSEKLQVYDIIDGDYELIISPGGTVDRIASNSSKQVVAFSDHGYEPSIYVWCHGEFISELKGLSLK